MNIDNSGYSLASILNGSDIARQRHLTERYVNRPSFYFLEFLSWKKKKNPCLVNHQIHIDTQWMNFLPSRIIPNLNL
ncbi:hypothetical protein HK16_18345 [Acetobacter senegalensis]|uniref:Uncharacterized protein n=2 Tax=Acetobacter TaxID=434 RepID=A0A252EMF6_9PROT|nr:hypothetical protein WG31_14645 [Acetobacter oryzifermentans]OUL67444.1 hypothetical protein HK16_18345 [Acetobacter senegalensis]